MWDFPLIPDQASTGAKSVDAIMLFELAVVVVFTLLVAALILVLCIRYRRGTRVDRTAPPTHSNLLEATWIVPPLFISAVMFVWSADVFFEVSTPPGDAQTIYVVGNQWMWKTQHPEGKREINELHLPLGRPIVLKMISQDVIHSFFIPAFRVKQDVLPGRYTMLSFQPSKTGKFNLFCAEYCGTEHSRMGGHVYVMEPAEYDAWLAEGQSTTESMAQEGRRLFVENHCSGCHGPDSSVQAPRLEGVYGKPVPIQVGEAESEEVKFVMADDRYIRDSILLPKNEVVAGFKPIMPSYQGQISEQDLVKIVEYIKSIGAEEPAE